MKLVICVNHFDPLIGGCEIVTKTLAEHWSANHDVTVLTRRLKKPRNHEKYTKYKVCEYLFGDQKAFIQILEKLNPDLVFVYSDIFDFFRLIALQSTPLFTRFRIILALCGANWLYQNKNFINILNRNMANIEVLICHSEHDRDFRMCSSGNFKDKTIVIPNGVNVSEFDNNTLTRQDLLPELTSKRWVLNVSNFFPGKGQEHLVHILGNVTNPSEVVYLQVSNDIEFSIGKILEQKWKMTSYNLKKKGMSVQLLKNQSREKVIGFFKNSNVFAFTTEKEVAPLVLLESMAAELPWISTDVGNAVGLRGGTFIRAPKNRMYHSVFDKRVADLFLQAIYNVWNLPKIGEAGRKQINEELVWDKILPRYSELIEK